MTQLMISCAAKMTLIFAIAGVLSFAAGRKSASLRHHIWALAIAAALLLPLLEWAMPAWHWNAFPTVALQQAAPGAAQHAGSIPATTLTVFGRAPAPNWSAALLSIWAAGFLLMLLRPFAGSMRLKWTAIHAQPLRDPAFAASVQHCARSMGVQREVRILLVDDARTMPCTWGLVRPRILLPSGCLEWPDARREVVLAHELSHIQRLDWPVRLLAELARALYWFHPLAWYAAAKLREESKRACDDAVLAFGQDPARYAGELLGLVRSARTQYTWSPALAVARQSNLERRFTAMLDTSINRRRLTRKAATLTTLASLLLLLPLAAVRAPAQDASDPFRGSVLDADGKPITNATIALTNGASRAVEMATSDAAGQFHFRALPAGEYSLRVLKAGFELYTKPDVDVKAAGNAPETISLRAGSLAEASSWTAQKMIRVGGNVAAAGLINKVAPSYPERAKAARIQGAVTLEAVITKEGVPSSLRVVNAEIDPDLASAAVEAVQQWRYQPMLLNGEPVEALTTVVVNFTLSL